MLFLKSQNTSTIKAIRKVFQNTVSKQFQQQCFPLGKHHMCPLAFSRLTCSQCHVLVSIKLNEPINVRVHCLMTISLSLISVQVKNVYIHLTQLYVLKINQPSTVYVITHVLALLKHTMQSMMCTMSIQMHHSLSHRNWLSYQLSFGVCSH